MLTDITVNNSCLLVQHFQKFCHSSNKYYIYIIVVYKHLINSIYGKTMFVNYFPHTYTLIEWFNFFHLRFMLFIKYLLLHINILSKLHSKYKLKVYSNLLQINWSFIYIALDVNQKEFNHNNNNNSKTKPNRHHQNTTFYVKYSILKQKCCQIRIYSGEESFN